MLPGALKNFISGGKPEFLSCYNCTQSPSARSEHLCVCNGVGTNSSPGGLAVRAVETQCAHAGVSWPLWLVFYPLEHKLEESNGS